MKCILSTEELKEGLKKINRMKDNKDLPILEGVKIIVDNKVQLEKTDLVNYATITIEDIEVLEQGQIVVMNPKELEKSFKFMKENYTTIETEDMKVNIKNGSKTITLKGQKAEEYPKNFNDIEIEDTYIYNTKSLHDRLKKVEFSKSKDEIRPILTGIHFNESDMVALDGYRLAISTDENLKINKPFTINPELIDFLLKTLNKKKEDKLIIKTGNYTIIEYENISITSKLLAGSYYNYNQILPNEYENTIQIDTKEFKENIEFLGLYAKNIKNKVTKMILDNDMLILKVDTEKGSFKTESKIKNNIKSNVAFNNKYMVEALKKVDNDEITIGLNGRWNPVVVEDGEDKFLILPIRVDDTEF